MGQIIVTMENQEKAYDYEALGVSFESTPEEILAAVQPVVLEEFGVNIKDESGNYIYMAKKLSTTQETILFPKSVAGNN